MPKHPKTTPAAQEQAEYFSIVLTHSDIRASVVPDPDALLEALDDFNPELNLMERYLPGCTEVVGRYGPKEFVVILSDTDQKTAYEVLESLCRDLASIPHETDGENINVALSIGVSSEPLHASVRDLLVAADQALYKAKREGRNRVVVKPDGSGA